ncbi:hypothetical protein C4580_00380 [Candidatus Woesearchaeota archaeon]|nr:MAG: hypothetical protein C4580_00380 [Candidatus Woesearchaeota archaeon]
MLPDYRLIIVLALASVFCISAMVPVESASAPVHISGSFLTEYESFGPDDSALACGAPPSEVPVPLIPF